MRKIITKALAFSLILAFTFPTAVLARDGISVSIEGEPVTFNEQQPVNVDGRVLVPVRGVFEHLGFEVSWNGELQQVVLTNDINTIIMTIGSAEFTTNGTRYQLDVPAQIINGSTMVPLRTPLESVGYQLSWDALSQTVDIARDNLGQAIPQTVLTVQEIRDLIGTLEISSDSEVAQFLYYHVVLDHLTSTELALLSSSLPLIGHREGTYTRRFENRLRQYVQDARPATPIIIPSNISLWEYIAIQGYDNIVSFGNLIDAGYDLYDALDIFERLVFIEANRVRAGEGLRPLVWNYELAAASRSHARDLSENGGLSHTGSDGSTAGERAIRYGFDSRRNPTIRGLGAEIASGVASSAPASRLIIGWYNSPGHRAALMLNRVSEGVGQAAGVGVWFDPYTLGGGRGIMKFGSVYVD